jgi:AraC-like DNA-binding protein
VLLNLYLSNRWLDDQCAQMSRCLVFPQPNVPVSDAMRAACTALVETLNTAPLASAPLVEMRLMRLVSATIQAAVSAQQWANMPLRCPMIDYRLRQVIAHMQENLESPQVAEQVADMVGLSRSRLFQLFSEQLASSPSVHWSGIRLEEAVTRLHGRAPQLTDLALDLGFSTPGNFSRFFRSHRGVTPSAYRRVLQAA